MCIYQEPVRYTTWLFVVVHPLHVNIIHTNFHWKILMCCGGKWFWIFVIFCVSLFEVFLKYTLILTKMIPILLIYTPIQTFWMAYMYPLLNSLEICVSQKLTNFSMCFFLRSFFSPTHQYFSTIFCIPNVLCV